jgi:hypothetical protein
LCVDLHLLSLSHQAELAPLLESAGKQVTAWKTENNNIIAGIHYVKM